MLRLSRNPIVVWIRLLKGKFSTTALDIDLDARLELEVVPYGMIFGINVWETESGATNDLC